MLSEDQNLYTKIFAVIRSRSPVKISGETIQEEVVQRLRMDRIRKAQEKESWVRDLKNAYLRADWSDLSVESAKTCSKMYGDYDVSEEGYLVYCPNYRVEGEGRNMKARLVIPQSPQTDFLHHYHTS